jgi:hypothetical protein
LIWITPGVGRSDTAGATRLRFPTTSLSGGSLSPDIRRGRMAMDDDGLVPNEASAALIVAPNTSRAPKRRRPTEQGAEHLERTRGPAILIDRPLVTVE